MMVKAQVKNETFRENTFFFFPTFVKQLKFPVFKTGILSNNKVS